MFLGYLEGVKAYCLWCIEPRFKKSIISRDVVFNEAEMIYKPKVSKCKPRRGVMLRRLTLRWSSVDEMHMNSINI